MQWWRSRFDPSVRKIHWRREWLPTPVFLPGKLHGQRNPMGYSLWGHKESGMTEKLTLSFPLCSRICFCGSWVRNPHTQKVPWLPWLAKFISLVVFYHLPQPQFRVHESLLGSELSWFLYHSVLSISCGVLLFSCFLARTENKQPL